MAYFIAVSESCVPMISVENDEAVPAIFEHMSFLAILKEGCHIHPQGRSEEYWSRGERYFVKDQSFWLLSSMEICLAMR